MKWISSRARRPWAQRALLPALSALVPVGVVVGVVCSASAAEAGSLAGGVTVTQPPASVSATTAECVDSATPGERYATFAAEMTAMPSSARMEIRVEVEQRLPGAGAFHAVAAPGLGVWRISEQSVRDFKYLRQVTNLAAPADYRASVHFRWLSARGYVLRRAERLTPRCAEPASPTGATGASTGTGAAAPAGDAPA